MTNERFNFLLKFADQWGSLDHAMSFELLNAYREITDRLILTDGNYQCLGAILADTQRRLLVAEHALLAERQTHAAEILAIRQ